VSKSSHKDALKKGQVKNKKDIKKVMMTGGTKMAKDVGSLIEKGRSELSKLTGLKASSTTGANIRIEMLEKKSIPDQMDILALYEVLFDEDGNLLGFERKSMRKRMEAITESE